MEIGGYDLIFDTPDPKGLAQKIMDYVAWPEAVIEMDNLEPEDFFWYKNAEAKAGWDRDGAEPYLANTMIYFLIREGQLTAVVDKAMAYAIRDYIGTNPNGAGTAL